MDPVTAIMLAKAIAGGVQTVSGMVAAKNATRPELTMPSGLTDAVSLGQQRAARTRLPGQDNFEAEIDQDAANAYSKALALGNPADISQLITSISGNAGRQKRGIATEAARYTDSNERNLQNLLLQKAEFEKQMFDINQLAPYLEKIRGAAANTGAGITNLANTADSYIGYKQSQDYLDMVQTDIRSAEADTSGAPSIAGMAIPNNPFATPKASDNPITINTTAPVAGMRFKSTPSVPGYNSNPNTFSPPLGGDNINQMVEYMKLFDFGIK